MIFSVKTPIYYLNFCVINSSYIKLSRQIGLKNGC